MREILNPYHPYQMPQTKRAFFGRREIVYWLEQQLVAERRVLILHGPQLIGKTTLIHFLPQTLTLKNVVLTLSFSEMTDHSVRGILQFSLSKLTQQAIEQDLVNPSQLTMAADTLSSIDQLFSQIWVSRPEYGLLCVIDDFDHLMKKAPQEAASFLDVCQSLLVSQPRLTFVLTVNNMALPQLKHPILDVAPTQQVTLLNANDTMQMITKPVEGVIRFDYGVPKRIAELTSNHPHYLTLFNHALFSRYARDGWINLRHLDETLETVLETDIPSFGEIWDSATWIERAILTALASVRGTHGVFNRQSIVALLMRKDKAADEDIIVTALEALTYQGILVKMGAISYKFYVDLFRYWLQKHHDLDTILESVAWHEPSARPEPTIKETADEADATVAAQKLRLPLWMIALIGMTLIAVLALGYFYFDDALNGAAESASAAEPVGEVVQFATATMSTPTITPTPEPTLTPTPTPPLVVARSLPSIAYMARRADTPWQIHVMSTDGSGVVALPGLQEDDTTPVWSPTDSRVAFVSQRDGNREIYLMDIDGENLFNFSSHPADDWTPAWSPDGERIVFSSNRSGNWEIYAANVDGSDAQQLTDTQSGNISPVWSPDGQQIAFTSKRDGNWEIYTMRVDGTGLRRLTNNEVNDLAPVWSFSGDQIAYETNVDGNVEVFVMNNTGGTPRNISSLSFADDHGPVWSPDDQRLVFYSNREGNWDIFSTNLDGSSVVNLTNTPDIDEQTPAWRP